jgi:hypothetical protein
MSGRPPKTDEVKYQVYINERKALVEGEQVSADNLDKNILTLAGGALGISLVFIEKIAPTPDPKTLVLLYIAWTSLVLSLLVTLSSQLTSQHAYRQARDILEDEFFPEGTKKAKTNNCWSKWTQILNWISIGTFIIGVGMLALFSVQNIKFCLTHKTTNPAITSTIVKSNEQQTSK